VDTASRLNAGASTTVTPAGRAVTELDTSPRPTVAPFAFQSPGEDAGCAGRVRCAPGVAVRACDGLDCRARFGVGSGAITVTGGNAADTVEAGPVCALTDSPAANPDNVMPASARRHELLRNLPPIVGHGA
ncbi:hypothetical protein, partial [Bradyrhizobium sp.]|uniref:hypothetical protein n=1 Tax=Bradyrhizobium sp. TaxID=376 RepID=UPI0025C3BA82